MEIITDMGWSRPVVGTRVVGEVVGTVVGTPEGASVVAAKVVGDSVVGVCVPWPDIGTRVGSFKTCLISTEIEKIQTRG